MTHVIELSASDRELIARVRRALAEVGGIDYRTATPVELAVTVGTYQTLTALLLGVLDRGDGAA